MKSIYLAIRNALKEEKAVKHFALWNDNIEQLSKSLAFGTPAVFLEFNPVRWDQHSLAQRKGDIGVILHLITRRATYTTEEDCPTDLHPSDLDRLNLLERLTELATNLPRERGGRAMLLETALDHSPSELWHDILSFVFNLTQGGGSGIRADLIGTPISLAELQTRYQ